VEGRGRCNQREMTKKEDQREGSMKTQPSVDGFKGRHEPRKVGGL